MSDQSQSIDTRALQANSTLEEHDKLIGWKVELGEPARGGQVGGGIFAYIKCATKARA